MSAANECQPKSALTQRCLEAVQAIEDVLNTPPRERHQIVDFGECAIVRLRDCLIEHVREQNAPEEHARLWNALDQTNVALSLITGVEYPGAGIQDKPMQMARDVLREIKI